VTIFSPPIQGGTGGLFCTECVQIEGTERKIFSDEKQECISCGDDVSVALVMFVVAAVGAAVMAAIPSTRACIGKFLPVLKYMDSSKLKVISVGNFERRWHHPLACTPR